MKIGILGSGSWGSAIAIHFGSIGFEVIQWCREKDISKSINNTGENKTYLPGIKYPEKVKSTDSLEKFFAFSPEVVFSVIPTQFCRSIWENLKENLKNLPVVCASKGIETNSLKTLSHVFREIIGADENYFVLSGPTFAEEVAKGKPTAAVLAGKDKKETFELVKKFNSAKFRLYASYDVKGVELGGALKNVIAIATGISDGMELGDNARAALITRGLHEIKNLGVRLGANESTFYGLSGMGDLILTCTGELSRNRKYGISLGAGKGEVEKKYVVEGIHTVKAAIALSKQHNIQMPISEAVYQCVYEKANPFTILTHLLSRPVKEEDK